MHSHTQQFNCHFWDELVLVDCHLLILRGLLVENLYVAGCRSYNHLWQACALD